MLQRARDLWGHPEKELEGWTDPPVFPKNGIVLLGGAPKIGKSFLVLDLCYAVTQKRPVWGLFPVRERTSCLYVEYELGPGGLRKRLTNMGEPSKDFWYVSRPSFTFNSVIGMRNLEGWLRETGARFLVLDPVGRGLEGDENSNQSIGELFRVMDGLIAKFPGLCVVLVHHFGKPPTEEAAKKIYNPHSPYNFRGASKWFDAPDNIITVKELPYVAPVWKRMELKMHPRHFQDENTYTLKVVHGLVKTEH